MNNPIKFEFLCGGNATFTVANKEGVHYTYKIRKPDESAPYFVKMLTGPNNENDYSYLGIFNPNGEAGKVLKLTAKSRLHDNSTPVRVFRWAAVLLRNKGALPAGYTIQHEGKCCRCGRTLTVPESIEEGIGPECKSIVQGQKMIDIEAAEIKAGWDASE